MGDQGHAEIGIAPQTTVRSTRELHHAHEQDLQREEKEASPKPPARTRASRQQRLRDWIDREDTNQGSEDTHLQGQEDGTEIPLSSQESWQQQNEETPMQEDYSDGSQCHVDSNASTMSPPASVYEGDASALFDSDGDEIV